MGILKSGASALAKYLAEDAAKLDKLRPIRRIDPTTGEAMRVLEEAAGTSSAAKKQALERTKEALADTPGEFKSSSGSPFPRNSRKKFEEPVTPELTGELGMKKGGRVTGYKGYGIAKKV